MVLDLEKEFRDLKRRVDLAETRLSQLEGKFEFISGQLRDIQLYMHARFDDIDQRFERMDQRFETFEHRLERLESKVDALPRVIAELIGKK